MPKVSVIVPNFNHARFLRKRIDSVLHQTFQDFELILLDDCSLDDSRSVLSEYARYSSVRIEFNEMNSGSAFKQWNKGVRLARGEYVWIAESDDYADERLLERLVQQLDEEPKAAFAFSRSWLVSEDDQVNGYADFYLDYLDRNRWKTDFCVAGVELCRKYFLHANPVTNASAVVFRKEIYCNVGGADEALLLCGDWKLWASMALVGKVAYLAWPLNYFRFHDMSMRNKAVQGNVGRIETMKVMRWVLDRLELTSAEFTLEELRGAANMWVPILMSFHVPLRTKRSIIQYVRQIDPYPIRRVLRPMLETIKLKFLQHWRRATS
jgi:glycosyltransferase involved in cell wall biosynthesis